MVTTARFVHEDSKCIPCFTRIKQKLFENFKSLKKGDLSSLSFLKHEASLNEKHVSVVMCRVPRTVSTERNVLMPYFVQKNVCVTICTYLYVQRTVMKPWIAIVSKNKLLTPFKKLAYMSYT